MFKLLSSLSLLAIFPARCNTTDCCGHCTPETCKEGTCCQEGKATCPDTQKLVEEIDAEIAKLAEQFGQPAEAVREALEEGDRIGVRFEGNGTVKVPDSFHRVHKLYRESLLR